MTRVLNFSPDWEVRQLRAAILSLRECDVVSAQTLDDAFRELKSSHFDVLLLCWHLAAEDIRKACAEFRNIFPAGKIVFIDHQGRSESGYSVDAIVSAQEPNEMLAAVTVARGKLLRFGARDSRAQ
jgi:DNA-binding response OmpR family regulator